jgi:hypothetical protein
LVSTTEGDLGAGLEVEVYVLVRASLWIVGVGAVLLVLSTVVLAGAGVVAAVAHVPSPCWQSVGPLQTLPLLTVGVSTV